MKARIFEVCFFMALAAGVVLAQGSKTVNSRATANPASENTSKSNLEETKALRKQQLQTFQEHILARTLDSIRNMDEPALRLSARNDVLTYFSRDETGYAENRAIANRVALDAIADFTVHSDEIPVFMADYLWSALGAWIQKYEPKLFEKFQAAKNSKVDDSEANNIRALLELKGGDALAAQRIGHLLKEGRDVDGLLFWLEDLMQRKSREVEPLLTEIVAAAERGPYPSTETIQWLGEIYLLSPQTPSTLKQRYLSMVVARTQPANFVSDPDTQAAYNLLISTLPLIRQLTPELYDQALTQSLALHASFSEGQLATEAEIERFEKNLNSIEDLIAAAEAAKSKSRRSQLLRDAAQMALREKRLSLCLDIVTRIDSDVTVSTADFGPNWKNQFLKDLIIAALESRDAELAEKGAGRITSPFARVEGLSLIMRYSAKADDEPNAERLLTEAKKVAGNALDSFAKARSFFLLSVTCDTTDESQKAPLIESAIKALNNLPPPASGSSDRNLYEQYLRKLEAARYQVTRSFKSLTRKDENGAIALSESFQKSDLKTFAMIGILQGLDELLVMAKK